MNIKTGVKAHDDACTGFEAARQVAVAAAGNNQASVLAAEITFYKNVRDLAFNNGLQHAFAMEALHNLGVAKINPLAP